ncbi:TIGR03750 family conjugal transfer protein [Pseudomonas aeruginosa]|uniref:TIGR03750 family conjugal transfer protein n=1 Tax=Pseudomonas aeruginosa TaxID=287 RepID=UPI0027CE1166|nr:TIGR03750 family conjugal transfer protein [Pseudomonas aeruginosa]MDQ2578930.1 TIGR03750 family conjugal transfer protein [Pseudomonas aeruginosa]MDQ2605623.1 TIGR03750 family conjugal transfer protein [Pseudomonas aeruginosa]MDT8189575.1 TIGR03750 family conjugal transfer protein [Pseudomonas aeruginosa]MDT8211603.1 TIGR03750 family conjugal transfer protein [Pseudomonas aeruginosa]HBP6530097.1 TIGR03750 family conjugal transfer protein [Pseudomonas aeruginosa]
MTEDIRTDGTVLFLPHRLNRHPVVVRGLTANELWVCAGLSGLLGLASGMALAVMLATIAIVPTVILLAVSAGIFIGGGALRRLKRGRPETWLYRQLQWWIALNLPPLVPFTDGLQLVTRSGYWSTRRSTAP